MGIQVNFQSPAITNWAINIPEHMSFCVYVWRGRHLCFQSISHGIPGSKEVPGAAKESLFHHRAPHPTRTKDLQTISYTQKTFKTRNAQFQNKYKAKTPVTFSRSRNKISPVPSLVYFILEIQLRFLLLNKSEKYWVNDLPQCPSSHTHFCLLSKSMQLWNFALHLCFPTPPPPHCQLG